MSEPPSLMRRYVAWVLAHRGAVLGLIVVLTALAGYQCSRGRIGSSLVKLFFGESEKYARYEALMEEFGASDFMLVVYEDDALLGPAGIARLDRITRALDGKAEVRRADSLATMQRMSANGDELAVEPWAELFARSSSLAALREEILGDPFLRGTFVSDAGKDAAVLIEFTNDPSRAAETLPALIEALLVPFVNEGIPRDALHVAGVMPESSEVTRVAESTMLKLFPVTCVVLLVVVWVLFRRLWPVTITMGIALISVIWAVAFAVTLDPQLSILIAAVPGVTVVICFSDIIHLCSAYLLELVDEEDKRAAILKAGAEVGEACFFTSLTTFVGFASMAFVPAPAFRQLGMVLGFGVAVALLLALTLVPIALDYFPRPDDPFRGRDPRRSFVAAINRAAMRVSMRHPKTIVALFAIATVALGVGASRLRVETNFLARLDASNPLNVAREYIGARFSGTNVVDVYVRAPSAETLLDPAAIARLDAAERQIESWPEIDQMSSVLDVISRLGRALGTAERPDSHAGLAQYLLLFEMSGGEDLDRLIDAARTTMRISLRLPDNGFVATAATGDRAAKLIEQALGPGFEVTPTGLTYLFGDWLDEIVEGQRDGLGFAFLATFALMAICVRSFAVGALSMIPNLLPLIALGGYIGFAWDAADSDVSLVAMIALGIGVDDTIHFLSRFRLETAKTDDVNLALERTFFFTGRAMVQTTLILAVGFAPFALSEYFSTRILGTLLPYTLIVALVADMLLVPALVRLRVIRFRRRVS